MSGCFKASPNFWWVHLVLAEAYAGAERHADAIKEYKVAIEAAPSEPGLHDRHGGSLTGDRRNRISHETVRAGGDTPKAGCRECPELPASPLLSRLDPQEARQDFRVEVELKLAVSLAHEQETNCLRSPQLADPPAEPVNSKLR